MANEGTAYQSSSEQKYSFGSISVKVMVDGDVSKPDKFCDYLLANAAAIGEIEALRKLDNGTREGKGTSQTCTNEITFGAISIKLELGFELASEVSNRTLNDIVSEIMLLLWTAYGSFMGNQRGTGQKTHQAVLSTINQVLEVTAPQASDGRSHMAQPGHGQRPSARNRSKAGSRR